MVFVCNEELEFPWRFIYSKGLVWSGRVGCIVFFIREYNVQKGK